VTCPSSVIRSMYADTALPPDRTAAIDEHLRGCASCRAKVATLRAERDELRAALHAADDLAPIPAFVPPGGARGLLALTLGTIAVAALAGMFWGAVGRAIPSGLHWLNPLDPGELAERAIDFVAFFINEGNTMITSAVNFAGAALTMALLVWGILSLARSRGGTAVLLSVLMIAIALPSLSHAIELRRTDGVTAVAAGETVDDTLVAIGQTVAIDGNVNGDLLAFGRDVTVRGNVTGNLITGAESVTIEGTIGGDVFGAGRGVTLRGARVARNVVAAGRDIELGADSDVGANAVTAGNSIRIDGRVGVDVKAAGGEITLGGNVQRDVETYAERVTLVPSARVGRNLTSHLDDADKLQIASGATVGGNVDRQIVEREQRRNRYLTVGFYVRQVVRLGAAFLTGLVLLWVFPPLRTLALPNVMAVLRAGGIGLVTAVTAPVAAVLACITVVGLPLGILAFAIGAIALYFSKAVLAQLIGRLLFKGPADPPHYAATLLAGLVIVLIAINLPYVGGFLNIVLTLVGLGMIVSQVLSLNRESAA
jgi:cytoskeletal protein CcmA (bactofilin family)